MKIFWVKRQKSVVESYKEAIIFLQIYVFENKRNIKYFWFLVVMPQKNYFKAKIKNIFIQSVKANF